MVTTTETAREIAHKLIVGVRFPTIDVLESVVDDIAAALTRAREEGVREGMEEAAGIAYREADARRETSLDRGYQSRQIAAAIRAAMPKE